ncbi:MAG TPA: hypothetical protein VMW52_03810 [Phycisphaerae bacterium]|nr:hypothetical protein [Phycisphaerae bacterium]
MAEPQPYPLIERIARAIATALATITAANGYRTTVSEVLRPRRTGERVTPKANMILLLQAGIGPEEELDAAGNPGLIGRVASFSADCVIALSESDARPMDEILNIFAADVEQCLMADPTWGGLAIDTLVSGLDYPEAGSGVAGVTVLFDVSYRTDRDDPYSP